VSSYQLREVWKRVDPEDARAQTTADSDVDDPEQ